MWRPSSSAMTGPAVRRGSRGTVCRRPIPSLSGGFHPRLSTRYRMPDCQAERKPPATPQLMTTGGHPHWQPNTRRPLYRRHPAPRPAAITECHRTMAGRLSANRHPAGREISVGSMIDHFRLRSDRVKRRISDHDQVLERWSHMNPQLARYRTIPYVTINALTNDRIQAMSVRYSFRGLTSPTPSSTRPLPMMALMIISLNDTGIPY